MPTPRDPAVTEYVRMRIKPMLERREILSKDLAAKLGVSPAYLSTLWKTGVGGRSIDGFARVLKFRDADELRRAAYDWYREQSPKAAARLDEPEVQTALGIQKLNHPNITDEQWNLILARFSHPDFAGRSASYWLLALGQEVAQDMLAANAVETAKSDADRLERWTAKRGEKETKAKFREAARTKKRLKEITAENAESAAKAAAEAAKQVPPEPPLLAERRR